MFESKNILKYYFFLTVPHLFHIKNLFPHFSTPNEQSLKNDFFVAASVCSAEY